MCKNLRNPYLIKEGATLIGKVPVQSEAVTPEFERGLHLAQAASWSLGDTYIWPQFSPPPPGDLMEHRKAPTHWPKFSMIRSPWGVRDGAEGAHIGKDGWVRQYD